MLAVFCGSQAWTRVTDVLPGQLLGAADVPGGPRSDPEWASKGAASTNAGGAQKGRQKGATTRVAE